MRLITHGVAHGNARDRKDRYIFVFLLIAAPVLLLYRNQLELLDLVLVCLAVLAGLVTWMLSRE